VRGSGGPLAPVAGGVGAPPPPELDKYRALIWKFSPAQKYGANRVIDMYVVVCVPSGGLRHKGTAVVAVHFVHL
jgi:hypothetical protein